MTSLSPGHWQIQDAKQRFSEMIRAVASEGPQVITRHGEDVAVVVDIGEYRRLTRPSVDLADILLGGFLSCDDGADVLAEIEAERKADFGRTVDLKAGTCYVFARHQRAVEDAQAPAGGGRRSNGSRLQPDEQLHVSVLTLGEIEQGIARVRGRSQSPAGIRA